jgi:hypothetical protein
MAKFEQHKFEHETTIPDLLIEDTENEFIPKNFTGIVKILQAKSVNIDLYSLEYYVNGNLHREDGPAYYLWDLEEYHYNGEYIGCNAPISKEYVTLEQFLLYVDLKKLKGII